MFGKDRRRKDGLLLWAEDNLRKGAKKCRPG